MNAQEKKLLEHLRETNQFGIICYYQLTLYPEKERENKLKEFLEAMSFCEGSEKERYTNIFVDLSENAKLCCDEWDEKSNRQIVDEWVKQNL